MKKSITIWNVPIPACQVVVEAMEREACKRISLGQYEAAEDILYSLKQGREELAEAIALNMQGDEEEGADNE